MKTVAMGDFYVWYCEWCDSRNLTPWAMSVRGKVCCGGCKKEFPVGGNRQNDRVGDMHYAHLR